VITGSTRIYGLIGDPVEHSLSPLMHNAAFKELNLNCVYLPFHVRRKELPRAVKGLQSLGISGFNVTIPHKIPMVRYLDEVEKEAASIGAINTVATRNGKLIGYNTDGAGAYRALRAEGSDPRDQRITILGAGGAARAVAFHLAPLSRSLVILNRTREKAVSLALELHRAGWDVTGRGLTPQTLSEEVPESNILINATSLGMYPRVDEMPVGRDLIHPKMTVFDIVYNPPQTKFLRAAQEAGAKVVGGLQMLVYQGILAFEIWTGKIPSMKTMARAIEDYSRRSL
jgi:shikimate dehydrogenase